MSKLIITKSVNEAFIEVLKSLYYKPDYISAPRGLETREITGLLIQINNPHDRLVKNIYRNTSLEYLIGEWLWYERGSNSLKEISYYSKFWDKISDNGKTANSAYGYRILGFIKSVNINQWEYAKNELIKDRDSRRAIINIYLPNDAKKNTKDLPCTIFLQFMIRKNKLHLVANMRSNDIILGFTYDAACFTMFQEKMLIELNKKYPSLKIGSYLHFTSSMHIYERHYSMMKKIIKETKNNLSINMPKMDNLDEIKNLQYNEKEIREGRINHLRPLNDKFCRWCQSILLNKAKIIYERNNN